MGELSEATSSERSEIPQVEDRSIERITELLDAEITHIRSEYERPGWTRWALLGGIASAVWLIMDKVEQGSFEATNVSILFLAFSLLFYIVTSLGNLLESPLSDSSAAGRFRLTSHWFAPSRAGLLLFFAHTIAVIIIAYSVRAYVSMPFVVTVYVVYGLLALLLAQVFALTFFPYPFPLTPAQPATSRVLNLVLVAGSLVPAVACLHSVTRSPTTASIDDFRIAALLIVLYYLLRTLVGLRGETPILSSLITTRRELVFGRIDIDTATRQVDIALTGLKVSDVLHKDIRNLLELWRTFDEEMHQASKKARAMQAVIENVAKSDEGPTERDLSIVESLVESTHSHMRKVSEILDEIRQSLPRFDRKAILLARSSRGARAEIIEVLDRLDAAAAEALNQYEEFAKENEALMEFATEVLGVSLDNADRAQKSQTIHQEA